MKPETPLQRAAARARLLALAPELCPPTDPRPRRVRLAIGDPQAPLESFLSALARRDLLGDDGLLSEDVLLVSLGDHFDWGGRAQWRQAADDALALLAWLAAHPPDQVVILLGNHDLGRVGELLHLDQARFEAARDQAAAAYYAPERCAEAEREFLSNFPMFPTAESAARDFSGFRVEQRDLVTALLREGRFKVGFAAAPDLLLVHAGLTHGELESLGVPPSERHRADVLEEALDSALAQAVAGWTDAPLALPGLHQPGDAQNGEGGGAFYHRPADPGAGPPEEFSGPGRRRYDPRHLPRGLTQAIGHVRDSKCRGLMPAWSDGAAARDGVLRTLLTDGRAVRYHHGVHSREGSQAGLWFLDAGMQHQPPGEVPLLDLDARAAV